MIKTVLGALMLLAAGAFILVLILFGLFFFGELEEIQLNIEQEIGGNLVVNGSTWMDIQSYGDNTTLSYIPEGIEEEYFIGVSDNYGRQFDSNKQIVKSEEAYLISVGNRFHGDKLYASKDLKEWQEFTFSKESIQSKIQEKNARYLPKYSPDSITLEENLERAVWLRRVGEGSDRKAQKIIFEFTLDWESGIILCDQVVEVIEDVELPGSPHRTSP